MKLEKLFFFFFFINRKLKNNISSLLNSLISFSLFFFQLYYRCTLITSDWNVSSAAYWFASVFADEKNNGILFSFFFSFFVHSSLFIFHSSIFARFIFQVDYTLIGLTLEAPPF